MKNIKNKQKTYDDYVYDPRDCKDCENYRSCYYIEGDCLVKVNSPICTKGFNVAEFNHAGCFSYKPAKVENIDENKLNITVCLIKISKEIEKINNMLELIKQAYKIK